MVFGNEDLDASRPSSSRSCARRRGDGPSRGTDPLVERGGGRLLAGCAQMPAPTEPAAPPAARAAPRADRSAGRRRGREAPQARGRGTAGRRPRGGRGPVADPRAARTGRCCRRARTCDDARHHRDAGAGRSRSRHGGAGGDDLDRATQAMLRALALDPANADAAKALRDIDRRRFTRIQAGRAAKVTSLQDQAAMTAAQRAQAPRNDAGDGYDLEQRSRCSGRATRRAACASSGRTSTRIPATAPRDSASRPSSRIADASENQGPREQALMLTSRPRAARRCAGRGRRGCAAAQRTLARVLRARHAGVPDRSRPGDHVFRDERPLRPRNAQAEAKLQDTQDAKAKLDRIDRDMRKPQAQR